MKSKSFKLAALAAAACVLAAYWYWSPFVTIWQMRSAAQQRDADAFSRHVDYPSLRDSLKGQFSLLFSNRPGQSGDAGVGAAFGKMLGLLVVDKFVDVMVRPETVMLAMRRGYLEQKAQSPLPRSQSAPSGATPASAGADTAPQWVYRRDGVNQLTIYTTAALPTDATAMERFGLVFQRGGFSDWKLAQVVLPAELPRR